MSSNAQCEEVLNAMGCIIGANADWLDGRLFQKLVMIAAKANYEDSELDHYGTFDGLRKAEEEVGRLMAGLGGDEANG